MVWISGPHPKPIRWHDDSGRSAADHLVCPLVFSLLGLLTDCLALSFQDEASLVPLSFVLIAGAAPVAAMLALRMRE
jgi:hypothetical protein